MEKCEKQFCICEIADGVERSTMGVMPAKPVRRYSTKKLAAARREFARLAAQLAAIDKPSGESRRARGLRQLEAITGVEGGRVLNDLITFSPELTRFIVDFAYGDVIGREQLDARTRALVVVAALAALGTAQPQLQVHIGSALNSGCTREEILEVLLTVAIYAGFPAALNGMAAARAALGPTSVKRRRGRKAGATRSS
jgi:4-carboxymuconolactone decarboxylase